MAPAVSARGLVVAQTSQQSQGASRRASVAARDGPLLRRIAAEVARVRMQWPWRIRVPADEGFEHRHHGRRMSAGLKTIAKEPVTDTEMLIAPDDRGAGWSGLRRGEPSERLTQGAVLFGTESLASVYLPFSANPEHRYSSNATIRGSGRALGEASTTR